MSGSDVEQRIFGVDIGKKFIVLSFASSKIGFGRIIENSLSKKISSYINLVYKCSTYVGKNNDQIIFGTVAENQVFTYL